MNTPADAPILSEYLPYLIILLSLPTGNNVSAFVEPETGFLFDRTLSWRFGGID
jgi:hypothetical protein